MDHYSHIFSQDDITLPITNLSQISSAPLHLFRRDNYSTMTDGRTGRVAETANHAPEQLVSQLEDMEELDTLSRPRLTQEQIAILEDEFKGKPKPGTDFKKQLAAQIGLSLQRVNNWYQNRRAKARHQKLPQESSRCEVLRPDHQDHPDPEAQWAGQNSQFSRLHPGEEQMREPTSCSRRLPSGDFISTSNDGMTELCKPYSPNVGMLQPAIDPHCSASVINNGSEDSMKGGDRFTPPANHLSTTTKTPLSVLAEWDVNEWISDPADIPLPDDDFMAIQESFDSYPQTLFQSSIEGFAVSNPPSHTFFTNSPPDGEANLMTPPPKASPALTMPPDSQLRRGSNSSQLADDLNTIRLQQSRSRLALYEERLPPPNSSNLIKDCNQSPTAQQAQSVGGGSPPSLDLNPAVDKILAIPRIDLASRRKRPRPAMLRPEAQRSQSLAGPLTMSPTSKVSSYGLGPSPSVRRIKSTGHNMNVATGRVRKSGLGSAQLSPRIFQTYLDAGFSQPPFLNSQKASTSTCQPHEANFTPLTPLSPAKMDLHPEIWPSYSPHFGPSVWENGNEQFSNGNFETGVDFSSPPITPFNMDAFPRLLVERPAQDQLYQCPQSAPPQQTTFFGDTSPIPSGSTNQPGWLVPTMPLEGYHEDGPMSMRRPSQVPQLAYPQPQRQFMSNYQHGLGQMGLMGLNSPNFFGSSPPPQKDLEIQVSLIPKPQGAPQGRKKYTFNHTTPKDYATLCA